MMIQDGYTSLPKKQTEYLELANKVVEDLVNRFSIDEQQEMFFAIKSGLIAYRKTRLEERIKALEDNKIQIDKENTLLEQLQKG